MSVTGLHLWPRSALEIAGYEYDGYDEYDMMCDKYDIHIIDDLCLCL